MSTHTYTLKLYFRFSSRLTAFHCILSAVQLWQHKALIYSEAVCSTQSGYSGELSLWLPIDILLKQSLKTEITNPCQMNPQYSQLICIHPTAGFSLLASRLAGVMSGAVVRNIRYQNSQLMINNNYLKLKMMLCNQNNFSVLVICPLQH